MRDVNPASSVRDRDATTEFAERRETSVRTPRLAARRLLVTPSGRRLHLVKMLTWRIAATTTTVLVTYAVTGDLLVGATVGGIEAMAKMALYYGHERAWARLIEAPPHHT